MSKMPILYIDRLYIISLIKRMAEIVKIGWIGKGEIGVEVGRSFPSALLRAGLKPRFWAKNGGRFWKSCQKLQNVAKLCKTYTKRCKIYAKRCKTYAKNCKILQNFAKLSDFVVFGLKLALIGFVFTEAEGGFILIILCYS